MISYKDIPTHTHTHPNFHKKLSQHDLNSCVVLALLITETAEKKYQQRSTM